MIVEMIDNIGDFKDAVEDEHAVRIGVVKRDDVQKHIAFCGRMAVATYPKGENHVMVYIHKSRQFSYQTPFEEQKEETVEKIEQWGEDTLEEMKSEFPTSKEGAYNPGEIVRSIWSDKGGEKS